MLRRYRQPALHWIAVHIPQFSTRFFFIQTLKS